MGAKRTIARLRQTRAAGFKNGGIVRRAGWSPIDDVFVALPGCVSGGRIERIRDAYEAGFWRGLLGYETLA